MYLVQGQSDYRIEVAIDYQDGSQITQQELAASTLQIAYKWLSFEDEDSEEALWTATGYGEYDDGRPYIYYNATAEDEVPEYMNRLVGRAIITDADDLVSKGLKFEIQVLPKDLA